MRTLCALLLLFSTTSALASAETVPFTGKASDWHGFSRFEFPVGQRRFGGHPETRG